MVACSTRCSAACSAPRCLLSALATRANLTGVSYDALLNSNIKVTDVVAALQASVTGGTATAALAAISSSLAGLSTRISLRSLIDAGPYGSLTAGQAPKVAVNAAAFDILSATGQIANGSH